MRLAIDAGKGGLYYGPVIAIWRRKFGRELLVFGLAGLALCASLPAADVVFSDGKVVNNVVVEYGEGFVTVWLPEGKVRLPFSAFKTINGKPPGERTASVYVPPPKPRPTPEPTVDPAEIQAAEPDLPKVPSTESVPLVDDGSVQAPTRDIPPVGSLLPGTMAANAVSPGYVHRWGIEWVLLGLLVLSGIWVRSLRWVQTSLFERREDPRKWVLIALLLPGIGAFAYWVSLVTEAVRAKRQQAAARKAQVLPEDDEKKKKGGFPWMSAPDPADFLKKQGKTRQGFEFLDTDRKSIPKKKRGELSSGLDFAREMLEEAILENASDVHIEPSGSDYRVRFRLDGLMHERMTYSEEDGKRMVTSLKTLAEIDVAEKRKAQDGRFRARVSEREVDFRVATANSIHGEKMVIRVLDHSRSVFDLTSLGMSDTLLATFQREIQGRNGMILATGPTGSGKTSTLYAALRQLDGSRLNIMTIEDPAEYELVGATQIAVNVKAGVTYESGLRSILRQDPDVILVGEMRDAEAAQVALSAALTGHLVFSSLHTKDAIGTVLRLQDMGIEKYQVATALLIIVGQRLVRVLCPHCREPYSAQGDELHSIGLGFEPGTTIYKSVGCPQCMGTGFKGRTGLFELLVLDDGLRKAISDGMDSGSLTAVAEERGFRSYRYDGAEKIMLGITTVEEVLQAN